MAEGVLVLDFAMLSLCYLKFVLISIFSEITFRSNRDLRSFISLYTIQSCFMQILILLCILVIPSS